MIYGGEILEGKGLKPDICGYPCYWRKAGNFPFWELSFQGKENFFWHLIKVPIFTSQPLPGGPGGTKQLANLAIYSLQLVTPQRGFYPIPGPLFLTPREFWHRKRARKKRFLNFPGPNGG